MNKVHSKFGRPATGSNFTRVAPTPAQPRVTEETRRWIAENLLLGAAPDLIASRLQLRGCQGGLAKAEIERALESPYFQGAGVLQQRLRKRDWLLASLTRLVSIDGGLDTLPRATRLPADAFFREYYAANRPVLIDGLFDHWPAMQRWSLDYFETRLGDIEIQVQTGRERNAAYELEADQHREMWRLPELTGRLRRDVATNDFYLTAGNGSRNQAALAPLWDDLGDMPGYLDFTGSNTGFFWMGPKGTVTPFHHDLTNNLLIQVRGRKRVTMAPSWQTPLMRNWKHVFSSFAGPEEVAALPDGERPIMLDCVLEPGQALFLPVGWWHHVVGLDMTIGMSFTNFSRDNDFYSGYSTYGQV